MLVVTTTMSTEIDDLDEVSGNINESLQTVIKKIAPEVYALTSVGRKERKSVKAVENKT